MIKQVHIKNFKAFQEINIGLKNLTIFTGVNGLGKSSFIQALLLLRQSEMDKTLPEKLILNHNKYLKLGKSQDVFNFHAQEIDTLDISLTMNDDSQVIVSAAFVTDKAWFDVQNFAPQNWKKIASFPLFNTHFQYLQADRISPKESYPTSQFEVEILRNLGSIGEYSAHFLAKYKNETVELPSLIDKNTNNTLSEQVNKWLGKISKGVRVISVLYEAVGLAKLSYQFEDGYDFTPEFSPVDVGFGLTYTLPVLVAVLSSKPGDLVIIENPESHLHPSGQSAIGQFLALAAQDGVQIIIETHSDHIIHGVRLAAKEYGKRGENGIDSENVNIYYLNRNIAEHKPDIYHICIDEKGKLYQIIADGKKTAALPKGFNDEWGNNMGKLI